MSFVVRGLEGSDGPGGVLPAGLGFCPVLPGEAFFLDSKLHRSASLCGTCSPGSRIQLGPQQAVLTAFEWDSKLDPSSSM